MILRVARHTNRLKELKNFYINILGLSDMGSFSDHDGYDGVFIGKPGLKWHLEFTQTTEKAKHAFDEDDLLILYPTNPYEITTILDTVKRNNLPTYLPKNPYWQTNGIMIKDPDGFGVIISLKIGG